MTMGRYKSLGDDFSSRSTSRTGSVKRLGRRREEEEED